MRRQVIDVSTLKLHPVQERRRKRLRELRATPTEQAIARQMAETERREERWRYQATDPIDST
jgi:hypothetical protein